MPAENLNRFDRIVAIFIHLQSGRIVKAQSLADRFQVSLRTIYRDIRSLEISGVPVTGEPGIGYSIMDGYRLPPVMFTMEEAGSFVTAEKLMQKFSDKKLGEYFTSAMFKVKSVLRGNAKDRVSLLESQVWINPGMELFNENVPDALEILLESLAEKKQVALQYQSFETDETTTRIIEPAGLFNENNFWYIMGYCLLRNDYRQFRTDRILSITRTANSFTKDHSDADLFKKATYPVQNKKVVIRVDKNIIRYIKASRKYYGFLSEKTVNDKVEMTFMISEDCDAIARWYMMFADCAQIIGPESFRIKVKELLTMAINNLNVNKINLPAPRRKPRPVEDFQ
ncbi:MAG: YafY family protein [Ferruginibacter sp.]